MDRAFKGVSPTTSLVANILNLADGKVQDIHVSRLKIYIQATLEVTEVLKGYPTYQQSTLYLVQS